MTIEKGKDWGSLEYAPDRVVACATPMALLASLVIDEARPFMTAGDLWVALGKPRPVHAGEPVRRLPIDVMSVDVDGRTLTAVESIVVRRRWSRGGLARGRVVFLLNAGLWGKRNLAPRAHPNDGKFDAVLVNESLSIRDRFQAYRRSRSGTHVPHPLITASSLTTFETDVDRDEVLIIDGEHHVGRCLTVRISPDYLSVLVPAPTVDA